MQKASDRKNKDRRLSLIKSTNMQIYEGKLCKRVKESRELNGRYYLTKIEPNYAQDLSDHDGTFALSEGFASHGGGIRATSARLTSAIASWTLVRSSISIRARHLKRRSFVLLIPVRQHTNVRRDETKAEERKSLQVAMVA